MKNIIGAFIHRFACANLTHIIWCIAILACLLCLAILHHLWRDDPKKLGRWRLLCLVPIAAAAVHAVRYVLPAPDLAGNYLLLHVIALTVVLPCILAKRRIGYRIAAVLSGIVAVFFGVVFCGLSPHIYVHKDLSYTDSFRAMVRDMDRTYILKEWKEVDFAALEAQYLPMVQEAEDAQDPAKFADAVRMFCNELHDGHVIVQTQYDKTQYRSAFAYREYGFSMVQLDDEDVIAVCTTDEAHAAGIEDGTVITHWNGKPIAQALQEDVPDLGYPVKANAERLAAIDLAATGGETLEVTFLDAAGKAQTVTLTDLGDPHTQQEARAIFAHAPVLDDEAMFEHLMEENFSARMLDEHCGYLRLSIETTDNGVYDMLVGYLTGDQGKARELFRERLRELREQGMDRLVIDLRTNWGGYDEIGTALCDLLTEDAYYGQGLGVRTNGQYRCVSDHGVYGDGEFADLTVVALTNFDCVSAGDGTSLYLSHLPNVTLAGITDPCGCNQETGGGCVLSDEIVTVGYPVGLILDADGVPNVDTRADRISRNPVEVRIPFDRDAAMQMFHDGEDYELAWAMQYLAEQAD